MRVDLRSLQIFACVAANRSLSKAAAEMHLTPSAVSKRIADLESRTGASLLIRHNTGVRLTPAGEIVTRYAEDILGRVSAMTGELSALVSEQRGEVRVMSNTTAILLGLLEDVGQFRRAHPGVHVLLSEGGSHEVVERVRCNVVDIGVCVKVDEIKGLAYERYRQTALAVVVPTRHPLAAAPALSLEDLRPYPVVWTPPVGVLAGFGSGAAVGDDRGIGLSVRSFDVVLRSVGEGAGIAVVPLAAITSGLPVGLTAVMLNLHEGAFEVVVCHDAAVLADPPVQLLFAWLSSCSGRDRAGA